MRLGAHQARLIGYQRAENSALLDRLGKHRLRLTHGERRRLAMLGKELGRKALQQVATIATPDTILRWYRELVAAKYDGSKKRGRGRPRKAEEIVRLLLEMAKQDTGWGYTRLGDALNNLGCEIGRTTVERILREHGIEPAPDRKRQWICALDQERMLGPDRAAGGKTSPAGHRGVPRPLPCRTEPPRSWQCAAERIA